VDANDVAETALAGGRQDSNLGMLEKSAVLTVQSVES